MDYRYNLIIINELQEIKPVENSRMKKVLAGDKSGWSLGMKVMDLLYTAFEGRYPCTYPH